MLITLIVFILALGVVVKGSDHLVTAAERTAKLLGISELTIGLTMVAIGTSMPEAVTSIASALQQHTSIATGLILGSNMVNMGLLLGIASLLLPMDIKKKIYRKETLMLLLITVLWYFLAQHGISRVEGIILLVLGIVYISRVIRRHHPDQHASFEYLLTHWYRPLTHHLIKKHDHKLHAGLDYKEYQKLVQQAHPYTHKKKAVIKEVLHVLFACVVIFIGTKYLISSTITLATGLHIPEEIIAMSAIALGTAMPEIMVTIAAARRKLGDLLIGNILGSAMTNLLIVSGITATLSPLAISAFDLYFAIPMAILITVMFLRYLQVKWFDRIMEGVILLVIYALFLAALVLIHMVGATKAL